MRKVILSMLVSLDGLTARRDGNLDWFLNDSEFERYSLNALRSVDAILVGRVTYQMFAEYWPKAGTAQAARPPGEGFTNPEQEVEMAELMNSLPKIVFSRTLERADWGPSRIVRDRIMEEVATLKSQPGKDLVLFAGANIAQSFMRLDLIDEYRLVIHPILLSQGIPLFANLEQERKLALLTSTTFKSGLVALHYARARETEMT